MKSQFDNRKAFSLSIRSHLQDVELLRQITGVLKAASKFELAIYNFELVILALFRGLKNLSKVHLACLIYFKNRSEVGVRQHPDCVHFSIRYCVFLR